MKAGKMTESSPSRGFRLGRGIATVAVLVVFGIAPLLGVAHLFTTTHTTCPVDGELVDDADARTPAAPVRIFVEVEAAGDAGATDTHSHHHCEAIPRRELPARRVARAGVPAALAVASAPRHELRRTLREPSVPLLRLAPKASPPA